MKKLILVLLLLATSLGISLAHAALFDDTEARKKILEVETTMKTQSQASQAEIQGIKDKQSSIDQRLGQNILDLLNEIQALKQEIATLKGDLELANHNIENVQQRQKELYNDTDTRLRAIEDQTKPQTPSQSLTTNPNEATPVPEKNALEYQQLELANGLSAENKHNDAFNAYDKFIKEYPNSAYSADAKYGLGYSQFALKNYKSAIITQQKIIDLHPESPKVPLAMFNLANNQIQLGLVPDAKKTLRTLLSQFPNHEVIPNVQRRLKALESIN